jgi:penicillin-binding protein 1C
MNQRDLSGNGHAPRKEEGRAADGPRHAGITSPLAGKGRGKEPERKRWKYAALAVAVIACVGIGALWGLIDSFGPPPLGRDVELSKTVLDRKGVLLRSYITTDGRWRLPASRAIVDPRYLDILLAYEDKRFFQHRGVDPLALLRAAYQLATNGQIVSGGSTITMQVARLLEPRAQRSLYVKLRESVRAIQLERQLTKDQILALYLTLAPCGGNLEGIRAASLAYFGKEPQRLTLGEAALLVALPQSPELRRPDRQHAAAKRARDRVLDRMHRYGLFSSAEIARAKEEPVPTERRSLPIVAPHAADNAMAISQGAREIRLTIDGTLQRRLERLARERADTLGPDMSVALLAIDNATGEVLARIGSPDYFDVRRAGQVDLTRAVRSPGSTLKPFIYGLGFEDGLIHPETLIEDRRRRYSGYAPENFDLTFQGTVTVRRALQQSLNVPAVAVLEEIGPSRLVARLREAGANLVLPRQEAPGLALGLGGVGISLSDLTMLYAGLARQGTVIPLHDDANAGTFRVSMTRLLDPVAAWYVSRVLQGTPPPDNAAGGRIAFKTGTSYGYRDAWAIGFDGGRTIGVWVGRPDGAPVVGLSGRTAAAPLLFEAFARWDRAAPLPPAPKGAVVGTNAKLPPPLRRFTPGTIATSTLARPPSIVFPPNGASLEMGADPDGSAEPIPVKIAGGTAPLTVLANGLSLETSGGRGELFFAPDGPGFVRLTVTDSTGAADSVVVRIQ